MRLPLSVLTHDLSYRKWSSVPHGLKNQELIVTLTSYPPRYSNLAKTLRSRLTQTNKPDRVILWLAEDDIADLPDDVIALIKAASKKAQKILNIQNEDKPAHGFELRICEDLKSYKKIIPALEEFPDAVLVTADDDLLYSRQWLSQLVKGWKQKNCDCKTIICFRAHGIKFDKYGFPIPYKKWAWAISGPITSKNIFVTSGAGALYPPGSLAKETTDQPLFRQIAPHADDVWLHAMVRLQNSTTYKIEQDHMILMWPGSTDKQLSTDNVNNGGNDKQIAAVINKFGPWFSECESETFDGVALSEMD